MRDRTQSHRDSGSVAVRSLGPVWLLAPVLLSAACIAHVPPSAPTPELPEPGVEVQRSISSGEAHEYTLRATGPTFLRLHVDASQTDLTAVVVDPQGEEVAQATQPPGGGPRHVLAAVLPEAGKHSLRITAREPGNYELEVDERRPALSGDERRADGLRALYLAKSLFGSGVAAERFRVAIDLLREAREILTPLDPAHAAYAALMEANAFLYLDDPKRAQRPAEIAWQILSSLDSDPQSSAVRVRGSRLAEANLVQAEILKKLGRPEKSLSFYERSFQGYRELGDRGQLSAVVVLINRAKAHAMLGDHERAEADYLDAMELAAQEERLGHLGWSALVNLADNHRQQGRMGESLVRFREARALADSGAVPASFGTLYLGATLGRFLLTIGDYAEAETLLSQALAEARRLENRRFEHVILTNLALLHRILEEPDQSSQFLDEALKLARNEGQAEQIASTLLELGRSHEAAGLHLRATAILHEALESLGPALHPGLRVRLLGTLARVQHASGLEVEALESAQRAVTTARRSDTSHLAEALTRLGSILVDTGAVDEGQSALVEALGAIQPSGQPLLHAEIRRWLGRAAAEAGKLEEAAEHLTQAVEQVEYLRGNLPSPETRIRFLARRHELYLELLGVVAALDHDDPTGDWRNQAFQVSEQIKARAFLDMLNQSRAEILKSAEDGLIQREKLLRDTLSLLYGEIQIARDAGDGERVDLLLRRAQEIETHYEALQREIRTRNANYADLRYPQIVDGEEVRRTLAPGSALLEYVLGPERSYLFVVQRSGVDLHPLPGEPEIRSRVLLLRRYLEEGDVRSWALAQRDSRWLFDVLLGPAAASLNGVARLQIVPDRALHYLPFEFLQNSSLEHAIESWEIQYAPSATVLNSLHRRSESDEWTWNFVAFAGPQGGLGGGTDGLRQEPGKGRPLPALPGSIEEAESIARLSPSQSKVFTGLAANQKNLMGSPEIRRTRWLHFATHGLIDDNDPMRSAIVLAPDANGDDRLEAAEVFDLKLDAQMVVLSACESGLGPEVRGEGLLGLTRGFLFAGSRSVVVSLWPVGDRSTTRLMQDFYRRMYEDKSASSALRRTKLEMIDAGYPPRAWAPFIVIGGSEVRLVRPRPGVRGNQ